MIQPQELRIGNYLNEEVLGTCIVSQITEKTIWVLTNNLKEDGTQNKREFHIWIKHLQPIPITEDELIKLGFKKYNNGDYWINLQTHYLELMYSNGFWYPTYAQIDGFLYYDTTAGTLNCIKYIHQLQNLYFVLTNKELRYNE